jgi:hypothetical protein
VPWVLALVAREENSMRYVVRCIEFLTCHVPRRCFILPNYTRGKRRKPTSRSYL